MSALLRQRLPDRATTDRVTFAASSVTASRPTASSLTASPRTAAQGPRHHGPRFHASVTNEHVTTPASRTTRYSRALHHWSRLLAALLHYIRVSSIASPRTRHSRPKQSRPNTLAPLASPPPTTRRPRFHDRATQKASQRPRPHIAPHQQRQQDHFRSLHQRPRIDRALAHGCVTMAVSAKSRDPRTRHYQQYSHRQRTG